MIMDILAWIGVVILILMGSIDFYFLQKQPQKQIRFLDKLRLVFKSKQNTK